MFIEIKARGNERGGKEGKEERKRGGWKDGRDVTTELSGGDSGMILWL